MVSEVCRSNYYVNHCVTVYDIAHDSIADNENNEESNIFTSWVRKHGNQVKNCLNIVMHLYSYSSLGSYKAAVGLTLSSLAIDINYFNKLIIITKWYKLNQLDCPLTTNGHQATSLRNVHKRETSRL